MTQSPTRYLDAALAWKFPTAADRLFPSTQTRDGAASLNSYPSPWGFYVFSYKRAADMMAGVFTEMNHGPRNGLALPAVFLYRHFLELALKHLIREAEAYLGLEHGQSLAHE